MVRSPSAVIIAALAVSCSGAGEPSEAAKMQAGKEAVSLLLRDPESAQFRNLKLGSFEGSKVVCGEVNAANGFGGMAGFKRFVSNGGDATMIESQITPVEFEKIWSEMC